MAESLARTLLTTLESEPDEATLDRCARAFVSAYGETAADMVLSLQPETPGGDATLMTLRVLTAIWAIEDEPQG